MSDPVSNSLPTSTLWKRWLVIAVALLCLVVVMLYLLEAEDSIDVQKSEQPPVLPVVSVERIEVEAATVEITGFAEVRPRWSVEIKAAVSGRVESVFDTALAGERVEQGTELLVIEDTEYVASMAAAEQALKEAQLGLTNARNDTRLARRQFKRDGIKPPNDLALHLPELRIAESALSSAEAHLAFAKKQWQDTRVAAPFSGFVTERRVSPGQTVSAGEPLLKLVDDARFELAVDLGRRDWALLQQPLEGMDARLVNEDGVLLGQASVRRGGGFLDEKTRQYKVFLDVRASEARQLLSGDFVRVVLAGKTVEGTLDIPELALTQEGYVWFVDELNQLQRMEPEVLFRHHNRIVIKPVGDGSYWRIATTPLVSFLPGQPVEPRSLGE